MADKIITEYSADGQVARLTLNAPKANILDAEMMTCLHSALDELTQKPHVKIIQFTGSGDHFSFGASVPEHTREKAPEMLQSFHGLFLKLARLSIPTAAVVSGNCLGGAMELALACNFIFADSSARFGQPEINLGVFAPPASLLLPLRIGTTRAEELLLTGRIFDAQEANDIGLTTAIFTDRDEMDSHVIEWTEKHILPKSAMALRQATKAARTQINHFLEKLLPHIEHQYLNQLMETHDANEGIAAFLEKRTPEWRDS